MIAENPLVDNAPAVNKKGLISKENLSGLISFPEVLSTIGLNFIFFCIFVFVMQKNSSSGGRGKVGPAVIQLHEFGHYQNM
jgi:hypothetical protein